MKLQLLFLLLVNMCLSVYGQDSSPVSLGNASELAKIWTKGSKSQARLESSSSLIVPLDKGGSLEMQRNFTKVDSTTTHLIGEVPNQPGSNVYLKISEGQRIEGQVLIPTKKEAYEYFTEGEEVFVRSVDIDHKLCVQYIPPPGAVSPTVIKSNDNFSQTDTVLKLQSLPNAKSVVLLDFDGEYVNSPFWNGGNPINAQSFGFQPSLVKEMWESISEDYRMFNVNITTDESVFNAAPIDQRVRCIFTPTDAAAPGYGGVAHVGSFNWDSDVPCFVFIGIYNYAAEAASHEIGHTLGLSHDGRTVPNEEYYQGQGSWAPIMGVSYYGYVTQWSKGEYANANNLEDDLSIMAISIKEGGGYRVDDHGDVTSSSTPLQITPQNVILPEANKGIIGKPNDKDVFRFSLASSSYISLTLSPNPKYPDLNIAAILEDAQGKEVANLDPGGLAVYYDDYLAAGLYYLTIKGNGDGDVLRDGYSDYASLGAYTISGYVSTCTGNYEPNQYFETAATVPPNSSIQAAISYAIDQDFYKITLDKPGNTVINLNNLAIDLDLSLYDAKGDLISSSQKNGTLAEKIEFVALKGDYVIKVNGRDGANSLSCYALSWSTATSHAEAYEPNNDLQSAPLVQLNTTIVASVNSNQDVDYYKLEIPRAGRLDLILDSMDQNYDLRFYNSSGQQLAVAIFKGAEKGNLSYSILKEGTYYMRIASDNVVFNDQCYKLSNTFTPAISSLALKFNGDNSGAILPINSKLELGLNDFTIEIFAQLDQGVGSKPAKTENLINNTNTATKNYAHLYLRRGATSAILDTLTFSSGNVYLKAKKNLKDGRCHHIAITKKDKTAFLYIDGKEEARSATSMVGGTGNSTSAWVIGAINARYQNYTSFINSFKGNLKELRIWNVAHSKEEINKTLNNGLLGSEKGLLGYWPFNEGSGTVMKDNCRNPVFGMTGDAIYSPSWVYNTCTSISIPDAIVVAGIEEYHDSKNSTISVYPNPFNEGFTFTVNEAISESYLLELTTSTGETVYKKEGVKEGTAQTISSLLMPGYYLLKLTSASQTHVKAIVKR